MVQRIGRNHELRLFVDCAMNSNLAKHVLGMANAHIVDHTCFVPVYACFDSVGSATGRASSP